MREIVLPTPKAMLRHAGPNVLEAKVLPLAIFLAALEASGHTGAVLAALVWTLVVLCYRVVSRQRVSGLIVLSACSLIVRTFLALATGSMAVYFLQPILTTVIVGLAILISVPLGRPLVERLAYDFCPLDAETAAHPSVKRFFTCFSLMWAAASFANAGVTVWLLETQSTATFVTVKSVLGPALTALAVAAAFLWMRAELVRNELRVVFGAR
jgi:intracellular septation protein A